MENIEIVTGEHRRCRYSTEEKAKLVAMTHL
ncbi:hypothetical protein Xhom_04380 [Xenorhabdus hominickii]|uniref:Uncharacterized protein n=1 Tax=Xenorhabdus hominickii TaxID=351679 RepID=A0A2G0Q0H2_XENHO|nr:hypothetical protein Xhom_04569 [Xenorhabdus hominickii]PHM52711.1 hypothetical protein Xhom_04380 [Xenorhabdus hominickii]